MSLLELLPVLVPPRNQLLERRTIVTFQTKNTTILAFSRRGEDFRADLEYTRVFVVELYSPELAPNEQLQPGKGEGTTAGGRGKASKNKMEGRSGDDVK